MEKQSATYLHVISCDRMIVYADIEIKHHRASRSLGDFLLQISAEGRARTKCDYVMIICDNNVQDCD